MAGRKRTTESNETFYYKAFQRTAKKLSEEVVAHQETKDAARQTRFELMMENKRLLENYDTLQDNFDKVLKELRKVKGYPQLVPDEG